MSQIASANGLAMTAGKNLRQKKLSLRADRRGARQSHEWDTKRADCFTAFARTDSKGHCERNVVERGNLIKEPVRDRLLRPKRLAMTVEKKDCFTAFANDGGEKVNGGP
ncbi:hypothetical protein [Sediminicola luteus]|uniref:Uncharacterized protein n=1 Tax=Sediminicola luteus TaxID=319238 RepID=A0ABV2TZW0_9FLAO